jgi:hypothetical protein
MSKLSAEARETLTRMSNGQHRSPPLPRAVLDSLLKRGFVNHFPHPQGFQSWRVTPAGRRAMSEAEK